MPIYIAFGRRRNDLGLMIDFHKSRALVRANTRFVDGVPLENIPLGPNGFGAGIVLIHRRWKNIYFLIERKEWSEDDYFTYAEKRILERNLERRDR